MLPESLESRQGIEEPSGIELANFFEEILTKGTDIRVRVTGSSMTPFLKGGEIVTISKTDRSDLRMGDLILFKNDQGLPVLHRILRQWNRNNKCYYQAKGDGLIAPDKPIPEGCILGKVYLVEKRIAHKSVRTLAMNSAWWKGVNRVTALWHLSKTFFFMFCSAIKIRFQVEK